MTPVAPEMKTPSTKTPDAKNPRNDATPAKKKLFSTSIAPILLKSSSIHVPSSPWPILGDQATPPPHRGMSMVSVASDATTAEMGQTPTVVKTVACPDLARRDCD